MSNIKPKFCAECGAALKAEAKFCAECGGKVASVASAPVQQAQPPPVEYEEEEEVAAPAPAPAAAAKPVASTSQAGFNDPIAAALAGGDHDDHHDDALAHPGDAAEEAPHKSTVSMGMVALAGFFTVVVVGGAYVANNDELSQRFQCNILGRADKCITDEDRAAELEKKEKEEELALMAHRYGNFDLQFDPAKDPGASVLIVQKRYEEDRKSFIGRITGGGVPCKRAEDCPNNYECVGKGDAKPGKEESKACQVKAGANPDNRVMKQKKIGDYTLLPKDAEGKVKGQIAFVAEQVWTDKHKNDPPPPPPPKAGEPGGPPAPKPGDPLPPPAALPQPPHLGPFTYLPQVGREVVLPMTLSNLPLLEKEQADGTGKRLTADDMKKIEELMAKPKKDAEGNIIKDPATIVKTTDLSTWVYEIELWAQGYKPRKILFYDDPAPPDIDIKKLEKEGWTTRKFKRAPDGKYLIDNAAFDLTPEPRTLANRYMQFIKQWMCVQQAPEFKGKTEQGKKDAEDLAWEQMMFSKEKRAIALENDKDEEFNTWRAAEMKGYTCPKAL